MSKLTFPSKPVLAVDWDGTCVPHEYPNQPTDWLPGAKEALTLLSEVYAIYIFTCRVAPVSFEDWSTLLPVSQVEGEINYIRTMLNSAGLEDVGIWLESFKIPAVVYIDDKAIEFTEGGWEAVLEENENVGPYLWS